ncbi:septum site-determining protein MinC [Fonticella tunisiensis]|uniref:Probable septum site-determining protein MinC n=1 Tax=Fonticella tunisiensis TaxID=1096341 RepID=A0A4R7KPX0_9CLOT|nr:septum site-determining protein MinC [Fonticella tunisiensis]TDT61200.1 septum site-determining protein MinC [Fonticella tunisiensis]
MSSINIKGYRDGLKVYVNSCSYQQLREELAQRIMRARDFFTGCRMYIVDEQKNISLDCYREIENYLREEFGITLLYQKGDKEEKKEKIFSGIYEGRTKFFKNTIRSGQRITYNGNIVVIGDINSGAEIVANGNIIVLGTLRGMAHAGYNGNKRAFVAAYILQPSQLRIADIIARSPDERTEKSSIPEVARIKDDIIIIEPYLPNKYL